MDFLEVFFNHWNEFPIYEDLMVSDKHYNYPKVNIFKEKDYYVVEASVPGVKKDELTLKLEDDNKLVILIAKKNENRDYILHEIPSRESARLFQTKEAIDENSIETTLEDGVLTIKFRLKSKARVIKIK